MSNDEVKQLEKDEKILDSISLIVDDAVFATSLKEAKRYFITIGKLLGMDMSGAEDVIEDEDDMFDDAWLVDEVDGEDDYS